MLKCIICGMEITLKNKEVNKFAFENPNTSETIEFCPFCGAGKEYISEATDCINKETELQLDGETLKILDHAVKLELFNADFYRKASALASDSRIKNMFRDLSRIEYVHATVHFRLGGFKAMPTLADLDYSRYNSDNALLEQAKLREKHAVDYYEKYVGCIKNAAVQEVLEALKKVEEEHISLLSI